MKVPKPLCGLLMASWGWGALACENPPVPLIAETQDSARLTRQIERNMQRYLDGVAAYVACIQAEFQTAKSANSTPMSLTLLMRRNNAAVAEFDVVSNLFIERVGPLESLDLQGFQATAAISEDATTSPGVLAATAHADGFSDAVRVNCISVSRLRSIRVINDQAVVFRRRSGRIFLNALDEACPGLQHNGSFSYQVRGARNPSLCGSDLIYPTGSFTGFGFPCQLGQFYEISESQTDELFAAGEVAAELIQIEPVELPEEPKPE